MCTVQAPKQVWTSWREAPQEHHTNVTKTSNMFMDTMKGNSKQDYY